MKIRMPFVFVLCAAGLAGQSAVAAQATGNDPNASAPAASAKVTKLATARHPAPSTPPARTTPPTAGSQTAVYHGAQGKKSAPGTACSSARLKPDGSLDCGMSGKAAAPPHPK
ncbi:MAG TPA: hypothetical protein VFO44_02355 [Steroidobacteraceae bacterium]|nr:hypothetical protein [Steroidobacteraceae bacterium]